MISSAPLASQAAQGGAESQAFLGPVRPSPRAKKRKKVKQKYEKKTVGRESAPKPLCLVISAGDAPADLDVGLHRDSVGSERAVSRGQYGVQGGLEKRQGVKFSALEAS